MNQKGQAFSVFELMIAGVVAFAILIVLLTVINQFIFNPQGNSKDAISQALKTAGVSGTVSTQVFEMAPGDSISATNFQSATGYDYQSVFFCKNEKLDDSGTVGSKLEIITDDGPSTISWQGVSKQKFKAKVVCESTNELIESATTVVKGNCSGVAEYCGESQPCCAVVFEKGQ